MKSFTHHLGINHSRSGFDRKYTGARENNFAAGGCAKVCPYPLTRSALSAAGPLRSITSDMPLPDDPSGKAYGMASGAVASDSDKSTKGKAVGHSAAASWPFRGSFTADNFTTFSAAPGGGLKRVVHQQKVAFRGLPHGAVATCSGHPDGGSCYCADYGGEYGYKGTPFGKFPGDGLYLYGAVTMGDGSIVVTTVVCEMGSVKNSVAVFRTTDSNRVDFQFVSYAVQGSLWTFPNVTSATSEHSISLLGDNKTILMVLRLGGDGQCSNPIGVYKPFYKMHSTNFGRTWTIPAAIEGSGCA